MYPRRQLLALLFLFLGCLSGNYSFGHELNSHEIAPGVLHVHELSIAISCAEPPFYGYDGFKGKEWDLVSAALTNAGHKARLYYLDAAESFTALQKGMVDGVWVCGSTQEPTDGNYLSAPLLPRQFVAITLAKSDLQINTLEDLAGKKVAFHPSLLTTLGPELKQIEAISSSAESVSNHELLAMLLYSSRIDVLISERSVFDYHLRQISPRVDTKQPIVFHNIFSVQCPRLLFQDKQLRDEFDIAWHELLQQQNISVTSPEGASVQDQEKHDEPITP